VTTPGAPSRKSDQPSSSEVSDRPSGGPLDSSNRAERTGPQAPGVSGDKVPSGNLGVDTAVGDRLRALRQLGDQEHAKQLERQNQGNQRWEGKMRTRL
jgi:hypothetical protein